MKLNLVLVLLLFLSLFFTEIEGTFAQEKPVQLALVAPVQLFSESTSITGIRFSLIYGKNSGMTGLDIGLANHTTSSVQKGIQFGIVGIADGGFVGWQDNFVNISKQKFEGLQWGAVNYHDGMVSGLQLGIVNYAASMNGLQIGLINIIKTGGAFPVFPIVNWSF